MHTVPHRLPTDPIELNRIQGLRLFELRIAANLSQTALARLADMETQELLAIEAGLMTLPPSLAYRLAQELGAPFSDLWQSRD